jgi:hypothetical protein
MYVHSIMNNGALPVRATHVYDCEQTLLARKSDWGSLKKLARANNRVNHLFRRGGKVRAPKKVETATVLRHCCGAPGD